MHGICRFHNSVVMTVLSWGILDFSFSFLDVMDSVVTSQGEICSRDVSLVAARPPLEPPDPVVGVLVKVEPPFRTCSGITDFVAAADPEVDPPGTDFLFFVLVMATTWLLAWLKLLARLLPLTLVVPEVGNGSLDRLPEPLLLPLWLLLLLPADEYDRVTGWLVANVVSFKANRRCINIPLLQEYCGIEGNTDLTNLSIRSST